MMNFGAISVRDTALRTGVQAAMVASMESQVCSVLQCVAVCCNVMQCVAVCCGVLKWWPLILLAPCTW